MTTTLYQRTPGGRVRRVYVQNDAIEEQLALRRPQLADAIRRGDTAAVRRIQAYNRAEVGLRW
jgi:hypothetical protein